MAKVIAEESGEKDSSPEMLSYIVCKGQTKQLDLIEMDSLSVKKKIYCFLTLTWAMISDIDIESEK